MKFTIPRFSADSTNKRLENDNIVTIKLYRVYTKSFTAYVVATNPHEAEKEFKGWLDSEDYGYSSDRVVTEIKLMADTNCKPNSVIYPCDLLIGRIQDEE